MNKLFYNVKSNELDDTTERRISRALEIAFSFSQVDGCQHKAWAIDQMVRALNGAELTTCTNTRSAEPYEYEMQGESKEYNDFINLYRGDVLEPYMQEDGIEFETQYEYEWDEGIAP